MKPCERNLILTMIGDILPLIPSYSDDLQLDILFLKIEKILVFMREAIINEEDND